MLIPQFGRDHHPRCFTMWMAGGGFRGGTVYGETDDFSYNIVKDPVHVRDFHATVLHQLGFDHERFTVKHQGLDHKLTGVLPARVLSEVLAWTFRSARLTASRHMRTYVAKSRSRRQTAAVTWAKITDALFAPSAILWIPPCSLK